MNALSFYTTLLVLLTYFPLHAQDGSLDLSFGNGGKVIATVRSVNNIIRSMALQNDGKIIAAGFSADSFKSSFAVLRYLPDGSKDLSFGSNGIVLTDIDITTNTVSSVLLQPDGKIIVAGSSGPQNNQVATIVRYNTDGTLDNTFNQNGKLVFPASLRGSFIFGIALQADNKIVVTGNTKTGNNSDIFVARITPSGALDTSFDTDGIQIVRLSADSGEESTCVVVEPNQKIVIAGWTQTDLDREILLVRFLPDGSLDPEFGINGSSQLTRDGVNYELVRGMQRLPNGQFLLAGQPTELSYSQMLVRLNNNGTPDASFGDNGRKVTGKLDGGLTNSADAIAIQADGKIITVGLQDANNAAYFGVTRYSSEGTIDSTFGVNGHVEIGFGDSKDQWALATLIQPDGKILVGGVDFNGIPKFAIARLNAGTTSSNTNLSADLAPVSLYPNPCPVNTPLTIHHPAFEAGAVITISNLNGIAIHTCEGQPGTQSVMTLPSLVPGVYVVNVSSSGKINASAVLVAQ